MGKDSMKRTIVNPHWINNARTVLSAEFHYDDGRILSAIISNSDTSNPDLAEIKKTFSEAELEKNTRKKISKMAQDQEAEKLKQQALEDRVKQEELFAAKLKIFDIELIKNSSNRKLKSQIRKSKSSTEAQAWAAALLLSEFTAAEEASPPDEQVESTAPQE
jgi:predicted DNA binding CopG/RHH family protein